MSTPYFFGIILTAAIVALQAQEQKSVSRAPQQQKQPPAKVTTVATAPTTSAPLTNAGPKEIMVKRAAIALDVVDREPRDTATAFPPEVRRLYCFSEIANGSGGEIQHRWYWNDDLLNSVSLPISADRYRTYSAKTIVPGMVGEWRVAIVDSKTEAVLRMVNFVVK